MIKAYKIMLLPNNKQKTKLFQSAGVARWAYNWTIARQEENHKNGGKFINDRELRKEITQLKKTEEYKWLNKVSAQIPKQAIKDACLAYKRFFEGLANKPKFKSKKRNKPSFYQRKDKLKHKEGKVVLEKIGWVKAAEPLPEGKYINPRVKFDGLNWWLTVGIEFEPEQNNIPHSEGIGIDLGVKDLAVVSTGDKFKNINKSNKVKKLEKRLKRLQRQVSRKYETNKIQTEGGEYRYRKTNNIKRLETLVLKTRRRLKNIRHNHLHQITSTLVKAKPEYVVMENLNSSGMMKNKKLSKAIQEQLFHEFKRQMEYKCEWNNIRFILADRFYPSSKVCSNCGCIKDNLKLTDRTFKCLECGFEIDRDLNASINLKNYGKSIA